MTPSAYQRAIFDFVKNGRGDAAVNAVAGSGKTTTLVEASKLIHSSNALFLAFNKAIVGELQSRLGTGVACKTINSLGHNALIQHLGGRLRLEEYKYREIVNDNLVAYGLTGERLADARRAVTTLVRFAQSSLSPLDDESFVNLMLHYGIEPVAGFDDVEIFHATRHALDAGEELARRGIVSFDDQIWLPVKWGLRPQRADFVMIDEAQDLSAAKLQLVLSARSPGGRMLFVGDPRQAIYGFAGADCNSFANIIKRTRAVERRFPCVTAAPRRLST